MYIVALGKHIAVSIYGGVPSMNGKLNKPFLLALIIAVVFLISCDNHNTKPGGAGERPKYVFLFIGDGMGFEHIAAAEAYLTAQSGAKVNLSFTSFPVTGEVTTHSADNKVTCSAAAGTAIAAGVKINNEVVGIDPQGRAVKSFTYELKKLGYKIGIATSVSIDHATPAAFYASAKHREHYYDIATQLAPSGFHYFAGSGFLYPSGEDGEQENVYDLIKQAGYEVVRTPSQLNQTPYSQKIVAVQEEHRNSETLVRAVQRTGGDGWTLMDFTKAGIERLNGSKGFFFMVEGGLIDFVSHDRDYDAMIHEMIDFSQSVEIALEFYKNHPNQTLIIVTSDHETGGLSANGGNNGYKWTTDKHTGVPVPIFALGAGSGLFRGKLDNIDIAKKIKYLMIN